MTPVIKICLLAAIIACGLMFAFGQKLPESELVHGKTIDKVVVAADNSQSYALYLPNAYDPTKKYPILYCFDPFGRGSSAVEKYRVAAEKYGYIVVGSNDSKNGMDSSSLSAILRNVWEDTHRRFSIDENRVLAAGLSGGARVASSFAFSCSGCVFGVIGSGAGFTPSIPITEKLPFSFFGTTGYDDFNYPEMRELEKKLAAVHVARRIEVFDGTHQWLTESLSIEALAWFELRAMKAGRRVKDDALIEDLFQKRIARAAAYLAEIKFLEAYSTYLSIVADFGEWRDVSSFTEKIRSLESSPDLKQVQKAEADQIRTQQQTVTELLSLGADLDNADERMNTRSQIHQKIDRLRDRSAQPTDSPDRRVARRCLDQIFVETLESATFRYEREGKFALALDNLELAGEVAPKNIQVHYNRARIYALQGDKKRAIEALTKAIDFGFKDAARIESEKAFDSFKKDERFMKLLAGLKQ